MRLREEEAEHERDHGCGGASSRARGRVRGGATASWTSLAAVHRRSAHRSTRRSLMPLRNLPRPRKREPPLTEEETAQLHADVSAWVEADNSTYDEDHAIMRRINYEAGGAQELNLPFGDSLALSFKSMQYAARAAAKLKDTLDDVRRRARAQERLGHLIRVILLFSRMRVALLKWYDDTCKKRYAPGQAGAIDAAEEFAGAARGQKRPRDEAGPSQ